MDTDGRGNNVAEHDGVKNAVKQSAPAMIDNR